MRIDNDKRIIKKRLVTCTYRQAGFTLIEALVAISLLMVAISSPMMLAQKGLSSSILSRDQMIASFLAQDGIEAIKNIRDFTAINQEKTIQTWSSLIETSGESQCALSSKDCSKSFDSSDTEVNCSQGILVGKAECIDGPNNDRDWLFDLRDCICEGTAEECSFDYITPPPYCNVDSTSDLFGNSKGIVSGIYFSEAGIDNVSVMNMSVDTETGLFKKYTPEPLGSKTKFSRKINIREIFYNDDDEEEVSHEAELNVRVSWDSPYGVQNIDIKTFIYNFESKLIKE